MTTTLASVILQAQNPNPYMMPIMLVGMIVVMYFFMIRPQQKRAKDQKKFTESMGAGDKVILTSGIHGRIVRTNDDGTLSVEIDRNTTVTVERAAISMEMTMTFQKKNGANNSATVKA